MKLRTAAVADQFYPADRGQLAAQVTDLLQNSNPYPIQPKALIVPHAGYVYSGRTAGLAFSLLKSSKNVINKIVILGPCHRVYLKGAAIPRCEFFETPLGNVPLDIDCLAKLSQFPQVSISEEAHILEHSIEVQLPFLQSIFSDFKLIPIVIGDISGQQLTEVINYLWGNEQTLIVVSSDLSHFLDYQSAIALDNQTTKAIESFQPDKISREAACGGEGIKALLNLAQKNHLHVKTLNQCNSADSIGDKNRVVGYGSYAFY